MAEEYSLKKKEFSYRGKSLEELKRLDVREFAQLLRANEKRSVLRHSDVLQQFITDSSKKRQKNKPVKVHNRSLVVVPGMIGWNIQVYNGKTFTPVEITGEMLGHRLGEFSVTRTKVKHGAAGVGATRSSASRSVK